jgi:hypothetical protein
MSETQRFGLATGVMIAVLLAGVVALVASRGPAAKAAAAQGPHLVSMEESGRAMQRAGDAMAAHARQMLDEAERAGDKEWAAHGQHWASDSEALLEGARWMGADPKAFSSLASNPSDPAIQQNWGVLVRGSEAMLHDLGGANASRGGADLEALRWNGQSMVAEGRNMAEHGRVMGEEVEVMVERHRLQGRAADELRQAAQAIVEVGGHLRSNGREMVDYTDRLRRSIGVP